MSPAGRPPLRGKSSMGKTLRVRLTEDEWAELEVRAADAGVSISEYVRAMALGNQSPKPAKIKRGSRRAT